MRGAFEALPLANRMGLGPAGPLECAQAELTDTDTPPGQAVAERAGWCRSTGDG